MRVGQPIVEFLDIGKSYKRTTVLSDLNLGVEEGTFTVVFGLPGSGRSVLLRLLMGLEQPTEGRIMLRGQDVTDTVAGNRGLGYVPQSFALFPNRTVFGNIGYPLELIGKDKATIKAEVHRAAGMLQIDDLLEKLPSQISGGQKQRVAIARGLVKRSDVYVLDDPLAGLDFKLRERLVEDLRDLQRSLNATFLYSTSDPIEAMSLAQNVAVVAEGRVVEHGKAEQLYREPQHRLTMQQLGFPLPNFFEGTCRRRNGALWVVAELLSLEIEDPKDLEEGEPVWLAIRPEHVRVVSSDGDRKPSSTVSIDAELSLAEDLGAEEIVYLSVAGRQLRSVSRHETDEYLKKGNFAVTLSPEECRVYGRETQEFISVGKRIEATST